MNRNTPECSSLVLLQLYYRNSSQHEPYLLTLPGCAPACPLDQFIVHCEPVIPVDWDRECQTASLLPLPYGTLTIAGKYFLSGFIH